MVDAFTHRRQQLVRGGGSGVLDCKFLIRERALCDFVRVSTYIPHDLCVCLIYTPFHGWRDLEGHKERSVRERAGVRGSAHACLDFFTRPPLWDGFSCFCFGIGGRDCGCTHWGQAPTRSLVCRAVRAQASTLPRVPRGWGCLELALARQDAGTVSHGLRHQHAW